MDKKHQEHYMHNSYNTITLRTFAITLHDLNIKSSLHFGARFSFLYVFMFVNIYIHISPPAQGAKGDTTTCASGLSALVAE